MRSSHAVRAWRVPPRTCQEIPMQFHKAPLAAAAALIVGAHAHDADAQAQPAAPQPLPATVVTATPLGSDLYSSVDPVNVLEGQGLQLRRQPTLGDTVGREVGVSQSWFGPNASRPIIRGLGTFDIRVLNNGLGILDASAASPDHAVAVSPFAAERIEVVRGPATVMYGGNAIGGVVNTIDSRIAQEPLARSIEGDADYRYGGANELSAGGARLRAGNQAFVFNIDGYGTRNEDLRIPGDAWTGAAQQSRGESGPSGRLPNSQGSSDAYGIGGSVMLDGRGYAGVSYSRFDSDYGTVAEPDVTIKLRQEVWNVAGELRDTVPGLRALRVKYGYTDYQHTEFEGSEAGTVFESSGYNLRVEGLHRPVGMLTGAVGLEVVNFRFSALGEEAFLPSTKTDSIAGFIYEELPYGPWKFSFGGRLESVRVEAGEFEAAGLPADSRSFTPWSAAAGAFYAFNQAWGVATNVSYTQRAPTFQELYADGPHIATDAFEVGDRNLGNVKSTAVDLTLKRKGPGITGSLGVFYNAFSNYVALFPTGIFRNPEDRSVAPDASPIVDPATGEEVQPLEQFDYRQVKARFYGVEAETRIPLWSHAGNLVTMALQADYVNATDRSSGQPLPFIPPLRFGATLGYERERFTAAIGGLFAAAQDRVPQFQTTTAGYADVFANAAYAFKLGGGATLEAFVQATNLLDQTIRYSTSNLKDIAPAGRRAVIAGVRGSF
jgi:iron complex outermembrane receptor protein